MFFPPCTQSAADTAPHGARAIRGRTREASSAVRTKLSAGRPLLWNRCETGSRAIPGRRSKRMPNVAAAGGRPAENGATPGSESLYLTSAFQGQKRQCSLALLFRAARAQGGAEISRVAFKR